MIPERLHLIENGFGGSMVFIGRSPEDHTIENDTQGPIITLMRILLTAKHLRRHEHGTADYSFGIGETGGHAEVDNLCPLLVRQVYDVLQFQVAVVNPHRMECLNPHKKIPPKPTDLVLAELMLVVNHIVVQVATTWEVLGDDVVICLGFEEVYDTDDLGDISCFLESKHLGLVFSE